MERGAAELTLRERGTLVAALRIDCLTAPYAVDGAMDGPSFLAYVEKVLVRDIVFMDNLRTHKIEGVRGIDRSCRRNGALFAHLLARSQPD